MSNDVIVGKLQKEVLQANKGKLVDVTLLNGQKISGVMADFDRYTLLVRTTTGKTSLIFKHAIMHIDEEENM